MKRGAPLKRTGFARKSAYHSEALAPAAIRAEERRQRIANQSLGSVKSLYKGTTKTSGTKAAPKVKPVRSEAYLRIVASLPCIHCCITGLSQAAHPNTGKGAGMKASDVECFPLCADSPGRRGCHSRLDQGALFPKERRRELEPLWGQQTRAVILGMGMWPAGLEVVE